MSKIKTNTDLVTEQEAKEAATEIATIKGFTVYFCETGLGYSALVFKNGHHIRYADEYGIHYNYLKDATDEMLKERFIEKLNNKLYTEEELAEPIKTYDEYTSKRYFLINYYHLQVDYISMFHDGSTEEKEAAYKKSVEGMCADPVGYCYISDEEFVKKHIALFNTLIKAKANTENDFEYQKQAFISEMYNHEYAYSGDPDYETLMAFGNIRPVRNCENELEEYFTQLGFSDLKKRAYLEARNEYCKQVVA